MQRGKKKVGALNSVMFNLKIVVGCGKTDKSLYNHLEIIAGKKCFLLNKTPYFILFYCKATFSTIIM